MLTDTCEALKEKQLAGSAIHYWTNESSRNGIVFLHPAFGDHTCFEEQVRYFSDYKLILPDLIGHGKSQGKGTIDEMSVFLRRILEQENVERVNLVGISLGSIIAQDFANQYPDQVDSMVCIGGFNVNHFSKELSQDNAKGQRKMMLEAMVSPKRFAAVTAKASAYTPQAQERFCQMCQKFPRSSFHCLASMKNMINTHETEERLYPLYICVGKYDNVMAQKAARIWNSQEEGSRYVEISDAGHLANMDNPDECNAIIEMAVSS